VTTTEVSDHPAVRAWRRLYGRPQRVERVKRRSGKRKKSYVYRLTGEGLPNGSVIGKLSRPPDAEVERAVYEDVLDRIALRAIEYYGSCEDGETGHIWLFIEDAQGSKFAPLDQGHRVLAGRWLRTLHRLTAGLHQPAVLPHRSADYYLELLGSVKGAIETNLASPHLTDEYRAVLHRFLRQLDHLLAHWDRIVAVCNQFSPTLVHCDLGAKNARVREADGDRFFLPFDWESAGWGVPAADLAQLSARTSGSSVSPDLEAYRNCAGGSSSNRGAVLELATVGVIFRVLHMLDWLSWTLPTGKIGKAVGAIRGYNLELTQAVRQLELPARSLGATVRRVS